MTTNKPEVVAWTWENLGRHVTTDYGRALELSEPSRRADKQTEEQEAAALIIVRDDITQKSGVIFYESIRY